MIKTLFYGTLTSASYFYRGGAWAGPPHHGGTIHQSNAGAKPFSFRLPVPFDVRRSTKRFSWLAVHILLPSILALTLGASIASYQLAVKKSAPLTPDDQQRISFEFNRYFVGSTLALQPSDLELKPVALSGQNQGGPAIKAVSRVVRVVRVTPTSTQKLSVPLEFSYISQGFNAYVHPGIDFVSVYGTPIVSAAAGCVKSVGGGYNGGYGNLVILDHGNGATTRYAHLQRFALGITQGACIDAGALIGYVGLTGRTTGPHLHFELRQNGLPVQPTF